jgi:fructokinase
VKPGRPLIFGEALFDVFSDGVEVLGGAPFNVAWHLQGLGHRPLVVTRVGADARGQSILARMRAWGMDTSGVQVDKCRPTGVVSVTVSEGEPRFSIVPDQAYDAIEPTALGDEPIDVIYHGSLIARRAVSHAALAQVKAFLGAPVFLDVNLRPPWWDAGTVVQLVNGARWLKLNEAELAALQPGEPGERQRVDALFRRAQLEALILTKGEAGAAVYRPGGEVITAIPPPRTRVVDTVGAGDAFSAMCLHGLLTGRTWAESLPSAVRFAAKICGLRGATTTDKQIYAEFK